MHSGAGVKKPEFNSFISLMKSQREVFTESIRVSTRIEMFEFQFQFSMFVSYSDVL